MPAIVSRVRALLLAVVTCTAALGAEAPLEVFSGGKSRLYLDIPAEFVVANQLEGPLADFERCVHCDAFGVLL